MKTNATTKPAPPPADAILLTVPETAYELRVSIATVYREVADGHLAVRKIRGKVCIHRDDLKAYIQGTRQQYRPETGDDDMEIRPEYVSLKAAGLIDSDDDFGISRHKRGRKSG